MIKNLLEGVRDLLKGLNDNKLMKGKAQRRHRHSYVLKSC